MISVDWLVEKFWLIFPGAFEPVQNYFNGDFFFVLARKLKKYPNKSILDLGCGVGTLLDAFRPDNYMGVDINLSFINLARKKYANRPQLSFIGTDVLNFQSKEKFDLVMMVSMIHHFPDQQLKTLLTHLQKNINFKYIVIIDGKPTKTIWKPLLQFFDLGADFRDVNQLLPYFKNGYEVIEKGNLYSNRKFYYYPFIVAKKKKR